MATGGPFRENVSEGDDDMAHWIEMVRHLKRFFNLLIGPLNPS